MTVDDQTEWRSPATAPIDGEEFLAELSNGWVSILHATGGIRQKGRYMWWGAHDRLAVPYEPSHPVDTKWDTTIRLTGWMPLPKSRLRIAQEEEEQRPV